MVTYDIVPEIESYLHTIRKRLHSSLDEREKSVAERMPKSNATGASDSDEEEDKNAGDSDEEEERGRSRKRQSNKKPKAAQAVPENAAAAPEQDEEDKGNLYERIERIYR